MTKVLNKREGGKSLADVKWGSIASWTLGLAVFLLVTFVITLVVYLLVTVAGMPMFLNVILVAAAALLWVAGTTGIIADAIKEAKEEREEEDRRLRRGY